MSSKEARKVVTSSLIDPNRMHPEQFRLALQHILRLGLPADAPATCACGAPLRADPNRPNVLIDLDHFQSCSKQRRCAVTARHDMIKFLIRNLAMQAGAVVSVETLLPSGRAMDLVIGAGRRTYAVDISVVHTNTPSARAWTARRNQIKARERSKNREYAAECRALGRQEQPFVVDSYGKLGDDAKELIRDLSRLAEASGRHSAASFASFMSKQVVFTLHKGNAAIMTEGLSAARRGVMWHQAERGPRGRPRGAGVREAVLRAL
jgi:hypothetical protein